MILWNIYEIGSRQDTLHGVMLRGRIRKFTIEHGIDCLVENASDKENVVRFAIANEDNLIEVVNFVKTILPYAVITKASESVKNPVLSKLKVNDESRYVA